MSEITSSISLSVMLRDFDIYSPEQYLFRELNGILLGSVLLDTKLYREIAMKFNYFNLLN